MADDRHLSISSSARISAEEVQQHAFSTVRRGLDPGEVRGFLDMVARELAVALDREADLRRLLADAEHRATHPQVDEEILTSALGEETARVLRAARDAATELAQRAEDEATRLRTEAQERADLLLSRAQRHADDQTAQSEAAAADTRQRVQEEAASRLEHARVEAEALLARTRAECRSMVHEAQELRSRVLADLAKRRRLLHSQIDQLRAGRERLAQTIEGVRHTVDEVADELLHAEDEARSAAETAARSAAASPAEAPDADVESLWRPATGDATPTPAVPGATPVPVGSADGAADAGRGAAPAAGPVVPASPVGSAAPASPSGSGVTGSGVTGSGPGARAGARPAVSGMGPEAGPVGGGTSAPAGTAPGGPAPVRQPSHVAVTGPATGSSSAPARSASTGPFDFEADEAAGGAGTSPAEPFRQVAARPVEIVGAVPAGRSVTSTAATGEPPGEAAAVGEVVPGGAAPAAEAAAAEVAPAAAETAPAAVAPGGEAGTGGAAAAVGSSESDRAAATPGAPSSVGAAGDRARAGDVDELFARLRAARQSGESSAGSGAAAAELDEEPVVRMVQQGARPRPRRRSGRSPGPPGPAAGRGVDQLAAPTAPGTAGGAPSAAPAGVSEATAPAGAAGPQATPSAGVPEPAVPEPAGPPGVSEATPSAGAAGPDGAPAADAAVLARRDDLLRPVIAGLARRLKRCLQDDQNDMLDRLRSRGAKGARPPLLLPESEHAARYASVALDQLVEASRAGAVFAGGPGATGKPDPARLGPLSDALASALTTALRRKLRDGGSDDPGDDDQQTAERIGAAFREWKGSRVEALAADHVVEAFSAALVAATPAGTALRWVVDDEGGACADCDDNALAEGVVAGDEYPTGHRYPPAHAGCRCLLVVASS